MKREEEVSIVMRTLQGALCMILLALLLTMPASSQTKGMRIFNPRTNEVESVKGYENSYAVCIGIDEYEHWPRLGCAVADAEAMQEKLIEHGFAEARLITNREATRDAILSGIAWLGKVAGREDRAVIYFSGHGETVEGRTKDVGYIIPVDCPREDYYVNAISMAKIKEATEEIKAKHILYVMDCCYSGIALMTRGADEAFMIEMTRDPCVYMITAGKAGEEALETGGHGIFTYYVLRGLDGEADYDKNGVVSGTELGLYSNKWVSFEARQRNKSQTPQFGRLDGEGEIVFVPRVEERVEEETEPPDREKSPQPPLQGGEKVSEIVNQKSKIGKDGAPMVLIPAGEFQMGSNDGDDDEKPVHTVYLDAFYMDVYEVTNALYKKFMDATGHKAPVYWNDSGYNAPNQPVVGVTWHDAKAYAGWAGKRLPTEAEWEKAARGGLAGKKYPWGDSITHDDANFSGAVGKDGWDVSAPVGSFAPNGYGLYDMAGNVREWCADWYDEDYYSKSPRRNPTGPRSGTYCVLRGGSWYNSYFHLRVASRYREESMGTYYNVGFRCVEDAE
jgi:sulfatase modifying factor 1